MSLWSILCNFIYILLSGALLKYYIKLPTTVWCKSKRCLLGKTVIITGANTEIGYDTALDFAKRGARLILACRDKVRAEEARRKIVEETGNENVSVELLDLPSFKAVRDFAKRINETEDRLDILVNNAGIVLTDDEKTDISYFLSRHTNHYSHFLLTILLIGLMNKTRESRVVNVSPFAGNHPDFCVFNILFTTELAKKLKGTGVTTYSLHPEALKTEILINSHVMIKTVLGFLRNLYFKTSEEGAQTTIYCSVEKGIEKYNGEHFDRCRRVRTTINRLDPTFSKDLWEHSEDTVRLTPEENPF